MKEHTGCMRHGKVHLKSSESQVKDSGQENCPLKHEERSRVAGRGKDDPGTLSDSDDVHLF